MFSSYSFSQEKPGDEFYVLDANWRGTTIEKAIYFCRLRKIDDTTYRWDNYNMYGPLVKVETFKNKQGDTAHGYFAFFYPNGWIDSSGHYFNGLAQGTWTFFNNSGKIIMEKTYDKGILIKTRDILKEQEEAKAKEKEEEKTKAKSKKDDSSFVKVEVESEFKGSIKAWQRFLEQNLKYPERAIKSNIQGDVVVTFIIDKDGSVIAPGILRSVEYSLDEEALRIIEKSNKWTPAVQDGKVVRSLKKQPIYFRLQ